MIYIRLAYQVVILNTYPLFTLWNSLQQREKLMDILLTKDSSALLKVLEILNTRECGYAELVGKLFADMDAMQKDKSTKPKGMKYELTNCICYVVPFLLCCFVSEEYHWP